MLKDYQIKRIKEDYPKGTEIELISMEDSQAVPTGTHGIVDFVDDIGTIQMTWDNGSSLGLVVGEDQFKVIKRPTKDLEIKELTCGEVKDLSNNKEYLVLQGCGGNLNEWVNGFTGMLKEEGIVDDSFSFKEVYSFQNGNLTNLLFSLDGNIDMSKLPLFRLKIREDFGAMWLSDYIDNDYIKDINI